MQLQREATLLNQWLRFYFLQTFPVFLFLKTSLQENKYCTFIVLACQEYPTSSSHKSHQAFPKQQVMASPARPDTEQESLMGQPGPLAELLCTLWESPCPSCPLNFESQHSHRQSTITSRDNLYSFSLSLSPSPSYPTHYSTLLCHSKFTSSASSFQFLVQKSQAGLMPLHSNHST